MIPDFQSLMLPLMNSLADGGEHRKQYIVALLGQELRLTDVEKTTLIPSGKQTTFVSRVGWAKTYLKKAGLISDVGKGVWKITPKGLDILREKPNRIDIKFLNQFSEFVEFRTRPTESAVNIEERKVENTPEETLQDGYIELRNNLASDLLEKIMSMTPLFFERLVIDLLVKMGYGGSVVDAGNAIGKSGDEGIDGVIKEDKLGLDMIYIQAKRYAHNNSVGRPAVQGFFGALAGKGASKGIFITTSIFTKEAIEYVPRNGPKIVLIDGQQLANYMIDYSVGCATEQVYEIKRIDSDYFEE